MQASSSSISYSDKIKFYYELNLEASGLLEADWLINFSNLPALIKQHLPTINWVGFYLNRNEELALGPFQGLPACTRIKFGKGVCGTSAESRKTIIVDDVDQFPGHIVCDGASRSEIVLPIIVNNKVVAVLDIDSPILNRFDSADQEGLEKLVSILITKTNWEDFGKFN